MNTVVIVDDQSAMRAMLRRALERHGGFDVREASDGRSAMKELVGHPPDAVIMDISMPGMDGLELLRSMQRSSIGSKAIVLSGHPMRAEEAIQAGADLFLPKTTSAKVLIGHLEELLHPYRMEPSTPSTR